MGAMGMDLGQIKLDAVGNASHDLKTDSAEFELMAAIDFFFDNGALDKMADLIAATEALPGVTVGSTYEKGLREILGKERADKVLGEIALYGKPKKSVDELEH